MHSKEDVLSKEGIISWLNKPEKFNILVEKSLTSTNTILKELAAKHYPEGTVLIAEEQTAGRGRRGRSFYSPGKYGVYFSVLLKMGEKVEEPTLITAAAAVAAVHAIKDVLGVSVGIKWVNDLYLDGKKVCGILTESVLNGERVETVILGVGINVTAPESGYPDEIADIATAVVAPGNLLKKVNHENGLVRCRLIAATLEHFWDFYKNINALEFLQVYKERSILIGHEVLVKQNNEEKRAFVLDIDNLCRLVVRYENGDVTALNSGEVRASLREL